MHVMTNFIGVAFPDCFAWCVVFFARCRKARRMSATSIQTSHQRRLLSHLQRRVSSSPSTRKNSSASRMSTPSLQATARNQKSTMTPNPSACLYFMSDRSAITFTNKYLITVWKAFSFLVFIQYSVHIALIYSSWRNLKLSITEKFAAHTDCVRCYFKRLHSTLQLSFTDVLVRDGLNVGCTVTAVSMHYSQVHTANPRSAEKLHRIDTFAGLVGKKSPV